MRFVEARSVPLAFIIIIIKTIYKLECKMTFQTEPFKTKLCHKIETSVIKAGGVNELDQL